MKRYVKIQGKTYPFEITQEAILQMAMDEGLTAEQVPAITSITQWPIKQMVLLILYGIRISCEHDGIECPLTVADIRHALAMDEQFQADISKANDHAAPELPPSQKKREPVKAPAKQKSL